MRDITQISAILYFKQNFCNCVLSSQLTLTCASPLAALPERGCTKLPPASVWTAKLPLWWWLVNNGAKLTKLQLDSSICDEQIPSHYFCPNLTSQATLKKNKTPGTSCSWDEVLLGPGPNCTFWFLNSCKKHHEIIFVWCSKLATGTTSVCLYLSKANINELQNITHKNDIYRNYYNAVSSNSSWKCTEVTCKLQRTCSPFHTVR